MSRLAHIIGAIAAMAAFVPPDSVVRESLPYNAPLGGSRRTKRRRRHHYSHFELDMNERIRARHAKSPLSDNARAQIAKIERRNQRKAAK